MPNDAKVGLVLGMGLVLVISVVFFHREAVTRTNSLGSSSAAVQPGGTGSPATSHGLSGAGKSKTAAGKLQSHTVREGDTLFSLAQRYYQDGSKFVDIYQVNREVLKVPDPLVPGTVLRIPEVPEEAAVRDETPSH